MFLAQTTIGDIFGFIAVVLAALSAFFMVIRGRIVKITKNLTAVRAFHVVISAAAGVFIVLHVAYFYSYPITIGVMIGYGSFLVSVAVWLTGTAFLERVKDSLPFHSSLSVVFISLALIHAGSASSNMRPIFADLLIATTIVVILVNIWYQLEKMGAGRGAENKAKVQRPIGPS